MRLILSLLGLLFVNYLFIDYVRRFFEGSRILLITLDVNLLLIYAAAFLFYSSLQLRKASSSPMMAPSQETTLPVMFLSPLFVLLIYVVSNSAQLIVTDPYLWVLSLRTYLLPIPMLFIGAIISKHFNVSSTRAVRKYLVALIILSMSMCIVQIFTPYGTSSEGNWGDFIAPPAHNYKSYGNDMFKVTSSFFSSSKKFARYLLISFLLYWGFRRYYCKKKENIQFLLVFILVITGIVSSKAREAFLLFLASSFFMIGFLNCYPRWITRTIISLGFVCFLLLFSAASTGIFTSKGQQDYKDSYTYIEYVAADPVVYYERVIMLFPFLAWKYNDNFLFGHGTGSYGQEHALASQDTSYLHTLVFETFKDTHELSAALFADSWLTRFIIEHGFVGFVLLVITLVLAAYYLLISFIAARRNNDTLLFSSIICVMCIFIVLLKAHSTLVDTWTMSLFWMLLGFSITRAKLWIQWEKYHTSVKGLNV